MRAEYLALKRLESNPDFRVLQDLWLHHLTAIEKSADTAAQNGRESSWRFYAGQVKACKRMMMALQTAILDMEKQDEDLKDSANTGEFDALMSELRGEKK